MKRILVDYCFNCPYHNTDKFGGKHYTCAIDLKDRVSKNGKIPEWCPLGDVEQSEDKEG